MMTPERAVSLLICSLIVALTGCVIAIAHLSKLPSERLHCPAPAELIWYPDTETVVCEK